MPTEHKTYELVVKPRVIIGKDSKKLRREHRLPAVVYGFGVEPTPVEVDQKEMERVYLHAGSNALIDLKMGDDGQPRKVFIHEVQRNPVSHSLIHIDFLAVNLRQEITTAVTLVLIGESPAVTRKEGVLLHALDHVLVRALPSDMLPSIEVDVSSLDEVDKGIHVSDLKVPSGVEVLTPGDELVAKITALRAVVEEVEAPEAAVGADEAAEAGSATPE